MTPTRSLHQCGSRARASTPRHHPRNEGSAAGIDAGGRGQPVDGLAMRREDHAALRCIRNRGTTSPSARASTINGWTIEPCTYFIGSGHGSAEGDGCASSRKRLSRRARAETAHEPRLARPHGRPGAPRASAPVKPATTTAAAVPLPAHVAAGAARGPNTTADPVQLAAYHPQAAAAARPRDGFDDRQDLVAWPGVPC